MSKGTQDELLSAQQVADILHARKTGLDKVVKREDGKLVVNHAPAADQMVRYISRVPMDNIFKTIMIMRIGSPLLKKKPLSHLAIGLSLGIPERQVIEFEQEGIRRYVEMYGHVNGRSEQYNKSVIHDALNRVEAQ